MSTRQQDELVFLASVYADPANDVQTLPTRLLTSPWMRSFLDALRDSPGNLSAALGALRALHPGTDWLAKCSELDKLHGLSTKLENERFAERILDADRRDRLGHVYAAAADACRKGQQSAADIRAAAHRDASEVECSTGGGRIVHVSDVMRDAIQDLKERMDGTKPVLTTGLPSLDKVLGGGLEPGWMVVVGARPKMGKTGFAGKVSQANALAGIPVFGCELEMSPPQQGRRILSRSGGPTLERVRQPKTERDMVDISLAYDKSKDLPWHFAFQCRTMDQVEAAFREWRLSKTDPSKPAVGVLDYLQLAEATDKRNREREVADMSRRTKLLAKELKIPILLLSQLNREVERRDPPRPQASDLRESGAIEQDADVILMLYRPSVYDQPGPDGRPDPDAVEILIPAQREGDSGTSVWARFIGERATFEERSE